MPMNAADRTSLLIISGPPCSGKTTLARQLGHDLGLPVIGRDAIKETLFDAFGWSDRAHSKLVGTAAVALMFQTLEELLRCGVSCIVESTFRAQQDHRTLKQIQEVHVFQALELACRSEPGDLIERFKSRQRHPGHADQESLEEMCALMEEGSMPAVGIGQILFVDAFDALQMEQQVLPRVREFFERKEKSVG